MNKSSHWYVTVLVTAASVVIAFWPGAASLLEFNRAALFALLGVMMLPEKRREGSRGWLAVIVVLLLGMVAKIAWEFLADGTIFVDSSSGQFVPVPLAHLVGAAVGLLVATYGVGQFWENRNTSGTGSEQWFLTRQRSVL